jgi:DNA-directed RNA polymerase beta' subunit
MPKDKDGKPLELLFSPLGLVSRTNASQLHEALLGKVAHAAGTTERLDAFTDGNIMEQVMAKLKQHHLKPDDDFFDPDTGRKIPNVVNGYSYIYKLKHLADSKLDERGTGDYASDDTPGSSSKRFGMLEVSAMVGHKAFDNLIDARLIRGQANSDFWRSLRTGGIPTMPGEPLVQKKFFAHLQGSGINVRKTPKGVSVFALAQQDVDELAGKRELKSRDTYTAKTFRPIDGGLFGQDVFGMNGDKWGYIQLDEPVPNPVMAKPLAKLLRMSDKDFEAVASGAATVNGMSSSADLKERLSHVNLDAEAAQAKREFKEATPSKKDAALKRYVAIENMRRQGVQPAGYMLDRIPVLPPVFRPVTSHNGLTMVADANYLYAQLLDARDDMREAKDLPDEYQVKARQNLYRTWNELTGMYEPEDPKLKNKNVGGLLSWALGKGSPKFSALQRKVVGMSLDTVGRGVIAPNAKLTIDQVGVPVDLAFGVMAPFVERSLVRRGYTPMDAMKMVKKRAPQAVDVLQEVMKTHPVLMNRAPTLHKFNIMAFEPVLVKGDAIQMNPSVCPGFGADYDGDTVNIHVPVSDAARKEAMDRMRPSRNLIGPANRTIMNKPEKEYIQGLYIATRMGKSPDGRTRFFKSLQEAKEAYRQGIIDIDTPIQLPDNSGK